MPLSTDKLVIVVSSTIALPVPVAPQPDEVFSCWLVRLANAHGLRIRSLCSLLANQAVEFNCDLDGPAGEKLLERVAACSGRNPEDLRSFHTYAGFADRLFTQPKKTCSTPWLLPLGAFHQQRAAMQFCPRCLQEGTPYYRRCWRLSLLGVCPEHRSRLHHVCPSCSSPVNLVRSQMYHQGGKITICWKCGADAQGTATIPAEDQDVEIALRLRQAAHGKVSPWNFQTDQPTTNYFDVLGRACSRLLRNMPRLVQWRNLAASGAEAVLPEPSRGGGGAAFDLLTDPVQRVFVLRTAIWLLENWPDRFLDVAKAANTRTSDFVGCFVTCPAWFLEPLQKHLTPPRCKPASTRGLERLRRMREMIVRRQFDWAPHHQHRLARALREAGFYSAKTDIGVIMLSLPTLIDRLRLERKCNRKALARQVVRNTPQWTRLLLRAKPYRRTSCSTSQKLEQGILLLCTDQFLSGRDLSELLHRSRKDLVDRHLTPMVRRGVLETKFPINQGGFCRAHPQQAYRTLQKAECA